MVVDVFEPHGLRHTDALPKLQGLALYASTHAKAYRRIECVAETAGKLQVLNLTRANVRQAIRIAARVLLESALAGDYV